MECIKCDNMDFSSVVSIQVIKIMQRRNKKKREKIVGDWIQTLLCSIEELRYGKSIESINPKDVWK